MYDLMYYLRLASGLGSVTYAVFLWWAWVKIVYAYGPLKGFWIVVKTKQDRWDSLGTRFALYEGAILTAAVWGAFWWISSGIHFWGWFIALAVILESSAGLASVVEHK